MAEQPQATRLQRAVTRARALAKRVSSRVSPQTRRRFGLALNLILAAILALIMYQSRNDLPLFARLLTWDRVLVLSGAYLLAFLINLLIWADMSAFRLAEWREALDQYVRTTFMARLPGGLWKIVGRMTVYRAPRVEPRTALTIAMLEFGLMLLAASLIIVSTADVAWWLHALGGLAVLLVCAVVTWRVTPLIPGAQRRGGWLRVPLWLLAYTCSWAFGGAMIYIIAAAFEPTGGLPLIDAVRLWSIAGAVGVMLLFLPLTALFRDGTLAVLLQPYLPTHLAVATALLLRLLLIGYELLVGWGLLGVLRLTEPAAEPGAEAVAMEQNEDPGGIIQRD